MREERFAEIVSRIFESNGFCRTDCSCSQTEMRDAHVDFLLTKEKRTYCVEVRMSRQNEYSARGIITAAQKMVKYAEQNGFIPMVVVGGELSYTRKAELHRLNIRTIIDIRNLLYMVQDFRDLYDELIAELPYIARNLYDIIAFQPYFAKSLHDRHDRFAGDSFVLDVKPGDNKVPLEDDGDSLSEEELRAHLSSLLQSPDDKTCIVDPDGLMFAGGYVETIPPIGMECESLRFDNSDLLGELMNWKGGRKASSSVEYERLCIRILKRLFGRDLALWEEQSKSNAGLFRFDMICKIKQDTQKDFWETVEHYFNSKYIVFEFKNYARKITQKEVYTTSRYLYTKALRGVAIIVSPNGIDKNGGKAIRGVLREEGKLIIHLSHKDMRKMLQMHEEGECPADHLSEVLDELLIDLEK